MKSQEVIYIYIYNCQFVKQPSGYESSFYIRKPHVKLMTRMLFPSGEPAGKVLATRQLKDKH